MIVDDHTLMRRIVREIIEKESDLEIVAEASNGYEAGELAAQVQPDVVLMDLDMPTCNGLEGTERILASHAQAHILIFTASRQEQHLFQALQRGAIGYITKDVEPDALVQAIRSVSHNELCLPPSFTTQVVAHLRTRHKEQRADAFILDEPDMFNLPGTQEIPPTPTQYRVDHRFVARRRRTLQHEQAASQEPSSQTQESEEVRPLTEREHEILALMRRGRKNREIASELAIAESTVHKHVQNIFEKLHARNRTEAIYLTSVGQ
jgi:DNA-binding NarL/FixJ family response regulator